MRINIFRKRIRSDFENREGILLNDNTPFAVREAYKGARTNLMFLTSAEKHPAIAFSSSFAGEGKTTSCINVAITFAQSGFKTLIVDADMRKPQIHRYFEIEPAPGLSDRLGGFSDHSCIRETEHENLFILPVGMIPPNPAELLTSDGAKKLFNDLREQFDYVFIDTPPVNIVTDAAVIGREITGVLMVARQDITTTDGLKNAVTSLEQLQVKILGFMLNGATVGRGGYYKKGYYGSGYSYAYEYAEHTPAKN